MDDGGRLACYFCADVVAPQNSMRDRTIDQQCTVTRPGLAPIASGMAVEVMVAMLHRKKGGSSALGAVPHTIRGELSDYNVRNLSTGCFEQCTACSPTVVKKWREEGFRLVEWAAADATYLEDLTGLTKLKEMAEAGWDLDDDSEDDF